PTSLPSSSRTRYSSVSSISLAFWLMTRRSRVRRSDTGPRVARLKVIVCGDGSAKEGVAHLNLPLPGTPVPDLWGNRRAPVVQLHPFLKSRKSEPFGLDGFREIFGCCRRAWSAAAAMSAAAPERGRFYPVSRAGVAERQTLQA